jgi:Domain of unknown function (DUF5753)
MSQVDLAAKLYISASLEGAIENATRVPKRGLAEQCDEIFGTTGTFVRLWKLTAQQAYPSWFSQYAELETEAIRIHKWELRCVPGLLQTADYARAIMRAGLPREANDGVHSRVCEWCQAAAGSGGSQGLPWRAARMASSAPMRWAAAESR